MKNILKSLFGDFLKKKLCKGWGFALMLSISASQL